MQSKIATDIFNLLTLKLLWEKTLKRCHRDSKTHEIISKVGCDKFTLILIKSGWK